MYQAFSRARIEKAWLREANFLSVASVRSADGSHYITSYCIVLFVRNSPMNTPTKVHTGFLAHCSSGICCTLFLCTMHLILLIVLLYCADHYASSSTLTQLYIYIS